MSTFTTNDAKILEQAFLSALQKAGKSNLLGSNAPGGARGASPTSPGASTLGNVLSKAAGGAGELASRLTDAGGVVTRFAGQLSDGNAKIGDAFEAIGSTLSALAGQNTKLSGAVQFATGTIGAMASYIEDGLDTYNRLSQSGATFNESVVGMKASAALSRVTLEEFADTISYNSKLLATFGKGVNEGAKDFTAFVDDFYKSGFGTELRRMGYSAKEVNELLASQMIGRRLDLLQDKAAREDLLKSSKAFAKELTLMSRLTGESRQAAEEQARKDMADGIRRAGAQQMELEGLQGVTASLNQVSKLTAGSGSLGDVVKDLLYTVDRMPTTEENARVLALTSEQFRQSMQEAGDILRDKTLSEEERTTRVNEIVSKALIAERARMGSNREILTLSGKAGLAGGDLDTFKNLVANNADISLMINNALKNQDKNLTIQNATADQINKAIDSLRQNEKKQLQTSLGNTTDLVITGQETLNQMRIALNEGLIKPLDSSITKFINEVDSGLKNYKDANKTLSNDLVSALKNYANDISKTIRTQQIEQRVTPSIDRLRDQLKNMPGGVTEQQQVGYFALKDLLKNQAAENTQILKNIEEKAKQQNVSVDQLIGDVAKKPLSEIEKFIKSVGGQYNEQAILAEIRKPRPQSQSNINEVIRQGDLSLLDTIRSGTIDFIAKSLNITGSITGLDRALLDAVSNAPKQQQQPKVEVDVNAEPREYGTPGMLNQLWDTPGLKLFEEGVKETVLTEDQLFNLVKGTKTLGIAQSLEQFKSLLSSVVEIKPEINAEKIDFNKSPDESLKSLIKGQLSLISESFRNSIPTDSFENIEVRSMEDLAVDNNYGSNFISEIRGLAKNMAFELSKFTKVEQTALPNVGGKEEKSNNTNSISSFDKSATTLDDVVKSLDMLNSKMSTLITQNEELTRKQINAVIASSESNIFERYTP